MKCKDCNNRTTNDKCEPICCKSGYKIPYSANNKKCSLKSGK